MSFAIQTPLRKKIVRREVVHGPPITDQPTVLDKLYRQRGVKRPEEVKYSLANLCVPDGLTGIDEASEIIVDAIAANANILIFGDYDADGATGCALACLALRAFGARHVDFFAPDRFKFGYGLSEQAVEFLSEATPDLLITVDNGITSVAGVKLAQQFGITVIITDHHLPGAELPLADAIVNPRLPGDKFPSKNLAGVGVIFYVMSVVRAKLKQKGWFERESIQVPNMADYLDLVALGTVADLVVLDRNNRALVQQGLSRINGGRCRKGIRTLLESGRRHIGKITEQDLSFVVAPRINAAGRLDDISIGIKSLVSNNQKQVNEYVEKLNRFNDTRKEIQQSMFAEATKELDRINDSFDKEVSGYCLFRENWHHGVVGLIASRVVELTGKPTVAFAPDEDGSLRGSCRSISGINIRDVLVDINAASPGTITKFGGHAMAAGLTMNGSKLLEFKDNFERQVTTVLGNKNVEPVIHTDGELEEISIENAELIRYGGPWGQGFPQPLFDGVFKILDFSIFKEVHLRLKCQAEETGRSCSAVYMRYFQNYTEPPKYGASYRLVYRLELREYRSIKSANMMIEYLEIVE